MKACLSALLNLSLFLILMLPHLSSAAGFVPAAGLIPGEMSVVTSTKDDTSALRLYSDLLLRILSTPEGASAFCRNVGDIRSELLLSFGVDPLRVDEVARLCQPLGPLRRLPVSGASRARGRIPYAVRFARLLTGGFPLSGWTDEFGTSTLFIDEHEISQDKLLRPLIHELAVYHDGKANPTLSMLNAWILNRLGRPFSAAEFAAHMPFHVFSKSGRWVYTCDVLAAWAVPEIYLATSAIRAWQVEDRVYAGVVRQSRRQDHAKLDHQSAVHSTELQRPYDKHDTCLAKIGKTASWFSKNLGTKGGLRIRGYAPDQSFPSAAKIHCDPRWAKQFVENGRSYPQAYTAALPQNRPWTATTFEASLDYLRDIRLEYWSIQSGAATLEWPSVSSSSTGLSESFCEFMTQDGLEMGYSIYSQGPGPRILGGAGGGSKLAPNQPTRRKGVRFEAR